MSFVGDKGREINLTFQRGTVQVGSGKSAQNVNEKDILERVVRKFKAHLEAKKNPIMEAVKFDRRRQSQGETFDSFVTDLKLLESDVLESDDLENGDLENNDLENDASFIAFYRNTRSLKFKSQLTICDSTWENRQKGERTGTLK